MKTNLLRRNIQIQTLKCVMCGTGVKDTSRLFFFVLKLLKYGIILLIGWVLILFTTILLVYPSLASILWVLTKRKIGS